MADLQFSKLAARPGDLIVCTLPDELSLTSESMDQVGKALQGVVDGRDVKVILLRAGTQLVSLSDAELAELGLQRVG